MSTEDSVGESLGIRMEPGEQSGLPKGVTAQVTPRRVHLGESCVRDHILEGWQPKNGVLVTIGRSYRAENTASSRGIACEPEYGAGLVTISRNAHVTARKTRWQPPSIFGPPSEAAQLSPL